MKRKDPASPNEVAKKKTNDGHGCVIFIPRPKEKQKK